MTKRKSPQLIGDRTSRLISALRRGAHSAATDLLTALRLGVLYPDEREGHLSTALHYAAELQDYLALRGQSESPADYVEMATRFDEVLAPYQAVALNILAAARLPKAARDVAPGQSWAKPGLTMAQVAAAEAAGCR